jgi:glycyl-tRNA synthetase beta subunit
LRKTICKKLKEEARAVCAKDPKKLIPVYKALKRIHKMKNHPDGKAFDHAGENARIRRIKARAKRRKVKHFNKERN